ncbi:MAG: LPS assembly protein LptD [Alphaproteobacteria bacterium]
MAASFLTCASAQAQLLTGYGPVSGGADDNAAGGEVPAARVETLSEPVELFVPVVKPSSAGARQFDIAQEPPVGGGAYRPLLVRPAESGGGAGATGQSPVDIQADEMSRDEQNDTVSASGDVMIAQGGRILRADEVVYRLSEDTVEAQGDVVLNEENGDIHLVDKAVYHNELRDGTVENLRTTLADGSRFSARSGELKGGTETVMKGASYTPCIPCKKNPEKPPVWGIVASEVKHDQEAQRISYNHARFEVFGVPIAYTPYFAHPDGSIDQKSGFLAPSLGYKSDLGAFAEANYYWAIAPDQDATFSLIALSEQAPLGVVEYRKRWENAYLETTGGITYSDRTDRTGGEDVDVDDELRGHILAEGIWNINDKWRSGLNVNWASDDQYMNQYDFTNEDVLENEIYVERFSARDYASARLLSFQDIRIRETALDQPDILPEMFASFKGEPGAIPVLKGNWSVEASALGLSREGKEQDVQRVSLGGGWDRRLISDYGLLTSVHGSVRGDVYHAADRTDAGGASGRSTSSTDMRVFPQFHVESSYPVARSFEHMQAKVEPVAALTFAPDMTREDSIPNEDSNDVQIDASNLFEPNRFPGFDRVEDRSRVTYGLRTGLFGYDGSFGEVFLGQSYRFDEDDNPFPQGSGLDRQDSDVVGQVSGRYKDIYNLNYRFQLNSFDLASERHEVDFQADWNRFRLQSTYLFASALEGTDITESREQLEANAQYYFTKEWRTRFGATQDLGERPGLRRAYMGLDYLGQCLFWSVTGQRNLTRDASGDSNTEILFRIGLKNLGEFEQSSLRPAAQTGG